VVETGRARHPRACIALALLLSGCAAFLPPPDPVPAPVEVREAALAEAIRYSGMDYEWGGDDVMPRGIDCSGLVVNVYRYAAALHECTLLFVDATAGAMMDHFAYALDEPEPGDLVFMGPPGGSTVTHVAVFDSFADADTMWVVDATLIPELGIDGVTRRLRSADDGWTRGYGRMAVRPPRQP
jgi:hypothetical protein